MANINLMDPELIGAEIVGADFFRRAASPHYSEMSEKERTAYMRMNTQQKRDYNINFAKEKKIREKAQKTERTKIVQKQGKQEARDIVQAKASAGAYKRSIQRIQQAFDARDINLLNKRIKEGSVVLNDFSVPKSALKEVIAAKSLRTKLSQMVKEGKQIVREAKAQISQPPDAGTHSGASVLPGRASALPGGMGLLIPIAAAGVGAYFLLK